MHKREHPRQQPNLRRSLKTVLALICAGATSGQAFSRMRTVSITVLDEEPAPYLRLVGPPPLRFKPAELPYIEPAVPVGIEQPTHIPDQSTLDPANKGGTSPISTGTTSGSVTVVTTTQEQEIKKVFPKILNDDTIPAVKPEDFLPYFLAPAAPEPERPTPRPDTIAPSSSIYRQRSR